VGFCRGAQQAVRNCCIAHWHPLHLSFCSCRYGRDSYNSYDTTTPPLNSNQYDSGYYGGENGRHIIRLTTALQEALLNASTITGGVQNNTINDQTLCRPFSNGLPGGCDRE
jgi:hypothetical protein